MMADSHLRHGSQAGGRANLAPSARDAHAFIKVARLNTSSQLRDAMILIERDAMQEHDEIKTIETSDCFQICMELLAGFG